MEDYEDGDTYEDKIGIISRMLYSDIRIKMATNFFLTFFR